MQRKSEQRCLFFVEMAQSGLAERISTFSNDQSPADLKCSLRTTQVAQGGGYFEVPSHLIAPTTVVRLLAIG